LLVFTINIYQNLCIVNAMSICGIYFCQKFDCISGWRLKTPWIESLGCAPAKHFIRRFHEIIAIFLRIVALTYGQLERNGLYCLASNSTEWLAKTETAVAKTNELFYCNLQSYKVNVT